MTEEQRKTRQKKSQSLEVRQISPTGYLVQSQSDPGMFHKVILNGTSACSCRDWKKNHEQDPSWTCKHIAAALGEQETEAPSKPAIGFAASLSRKERTALECAAMFGDPQAMAQLNGGKPVKAARPEPAPAVEIPRTVEQGEPLDPCQEAELAIEREAIQALETPMTLAEAYPLLTRPFEIGQVEVKPGAVNGTKALALAYVDMRAYQARLDEAVGPANWEVQYRPLGDRAVICKLTILGVTREDVGEADPEDSNAWTSAVAQSFKRTCASFGLGRYLYQLPRLWAEYDKECKNFKAPGKVVEQMYQVNGK